MPRARITPPMSLTVTPPPHTHGPRTCKAPFGGIQRWGTREGRFHGICHVPQVGAVTLSAQPAANRHYTVGGNEPTPPSPGYPTVCLYNRDGMNTVKCLLLSQTFQQYWARLAAAFQDFGNLSGDSSVQLLCPPIKDTEIELPYKTSSLLLSCSSSL